MQWDGMVQMQTQAHDWEYCETACHPSFALAADISHLDFNADCL